MNWQRVSESSRTMRAFQTVVSGSLVATALDRLATCLPILGRDVQRAAATFDDEGVLVVLEQSVLVRSVMTALERIDRARRHSRTAAAFSAVLERLTAFDLSRQIRLTALMLFSAVAVHLLLTRFNAPEPGIVARVAWITMATLLVVVIVCAESVAAAWRDRSARGSRNESDIG